MGQYYLAIILGEKTDKKEIIRLALNPMEYGSGLKLMEHSLINNESVKMVEFLLSQTGMFYKSRLVWAGDYADNEPESEDNLHNAPKPQPPFLPVIPAAYVIYMSRLRYIVNHTKQQFVDKQGKIYHPLPLLTAEGNGRGGGDYNGPCGMELVGTWARDVISMESEHPSMEYKELVCEGW